MNTPTQAEEPTGIIGKIMEDGRPLIYSFDNNLPPDEVRQKLPWLTVISWRYDGAKNKGMPPKTENQRMINLEDAIENNLVGDDSILLRAYSRTGNNLKELVYYIKDRDKFLELFNQALSDHPRYPIEIKFYEDREWTEFRNLLKDFSKTAK
jgi:hypothetical protein